MKAVAVIALVVACAAPGLAGAQQALPTTREGAYALGERFAGCSAQFAFTAELARRVGLPDTAVAAEGQARGWKVAGAIFLADGMPASKAGDTVQAFDDLVQRKVEVLRGMHRLDPQRAATEGTAEFERECRAWGPTQQKLVELMRDRPVAN